MSTRGSKLSRVIAFFREADVDEARVAFQLVKETMDHRLAKTTESNPRRRARKPRVANISTGQKADLITTSASSPGA